jgi:hypothetical protein
MLMGTSIEYVAMCDLILGFVGPLFSLKLKINRLDALKSLLEARINRLVLVLVYIPLGLPLPFWSIRDYDTYNIVVSVFLLVCVFVGTGLMMAVYILSFRFIKGLVAELFPVHSGFHPILLGNCFLGNLCWDVRMFPVVIAFYQ